MKLQGAMVAIVTPLRDDKPDLASLRDLVEWQVREGTDGIVPCGTTGEGVTLTPRSGPTSSAPWSRRPAAGSR